MPHRVANCEYCGETKRIMARGLCSPCYQRQWNTGEIRRKIMSNVGLTCSHEGCIEAAVTKGLCRYHYAYTKHPLTNTWHLLCSRYAADIPQGWKDSFAAFLEDVGERPNPKSQLRKVDIDKPWSATNVRWLMPLRKAGYSPERMRAYQSDWRMRRVFGIEPTDFDRMMQEQGGVCAICGGKQDINKKTGEPRSLAIDHCHATKKVRGLLCVNCNRGLGYFSDDIARLESAIAYLKKHA